jgi:hypothetical protein
MKLSKEEREKRNAEILERWECGITPLNTTLRKARCKKLLLKCVMKTRRNQHDSEYLA